MGPIYIETRVFRFAYSGPQLVVEPAIIVCLQLSEDIAIIKLHVDICPNSSQLQYDMR